MTTMTSEGQPTTGQVLLAALHEAQEAIGGAGTPPPNEIERVRELLVRAAELALPVAQARELPAVMPGQPFLLVRWSGQGAFLCDYHGMDTVEPAQLVGATLYIEANARWLAQASVDERMGEAKRAMEAREQSGGEDGGTLQ